MHASQVPSKMQPRCRIQRSKSVRGQVNRKSKLRVREPTVLLFAAFAQDAAKQGQFEPVACMQVLRSETSAENELRGNMISLLNFGASAPQPISDKL